MSIYTLCQRLVKGPRIGFEYDYMGAAEYEFGGTLDARRALNDAELDRVRLSVTERTRTWDCVAIFPKAKTVNIIPVLKALEAGTNRNKGAMWCSDLQGWLMIYPVPALIHMNTDDGAERARLFLEHGTALFAEGAE